ncbi:MAG: folate-binding protein YgfZ [Proteobacteria bacterium]|nr:folate-binding protein YgfZ [Pseudomonadota bacterium]
MTSKRYGLITDFVAWQLLGKDAATFLQGQFTCDVRKLTPGAAIPGACCDHKGRVQFNGWIGQTPENFILLIPSSIAQSALQHLNKFAIFSKIKFECKANFAGLNFIGPELVQWDFQKIIHGQATATMHWYFGESTDIQPLQLALSKVSQEINLPELQRQRILNRLVFIEPGAQGLFTPQMIELEKWGCISFNKGCYVGQEVVAKTQYLGQLKRHLHTIKWNGSTNPKIGGALTNTQKAQVGNIAATCQNLEGDWLLLAVISDHSLNEPIFYQENKCVFSKRDLSLF